MNHVVTPVSHVVEVRRPLFERAHPFCDHTLNHESVEGKSHVFALLYCSTLANWEDGMRFEVDDARARRDCQDRVDREVPRFRFRSSFSREVRVVLNEVNE